MSSDRRPDMSQATPGNRNRTLFDCVRSQAYRLERPATVNEWADVCVALACEARRLIPDRSDFPPSEAVAVGWSVASWTWAARTPAGRGYDHSPERQTWSAGKRWHPDVDDPVAYMRDRNREIVAACRSGLSQRAAATAFGVSRGAVYHVLRKAREAGPGCPVVRHALRTAPSARERAR